MLPEEAERAAQELVRALRGTRSQVMFARRLGYRANPITDWENGRRTPTAREVLRAAALTGVQVDAAFLRFRAEVPIALEDGQWQVGDWLDRLRGNRSVTALAKQVGCSRFSVARWLSGAAHPRLHHFLMIVDAITGRLPELLAELAPIEALPSIEARYRAVVASRTLAYEEPWTEAILRVLETRAYRAQPLHDDARLAAMLGIDEADVRRGIEGLEAANVIGRVGERYEPRSELNTDTTANPEALGRLRAHWGGVIEERALALGPRESFGYNVATVREADLELVREALRRAYREIRSLVADTGDGELVAFVGMQLLIFEEPPGATSAQTSGPEP